MIDDNIAEITRLDAERGDALVNRDWAALDALLTDDSVHIHSTGLVDDKAAYLEGLRTKLDYLEVRRISLQVRCYGDLAIATGIVDQTLRIKGPGTVVELRTATTQTLIHRQGRWRQTSFHTTRVESVTA